MEKLSTPIPYKRKRTRDTNETVHNNENEEISLKINSTGSNSPFSVNISPINPNVSKSRDVISHHETAEPDKIVEEDRTSFECNNSPSSEELDHNTSKSRDAISDHETAEPDTIVPNDPLQEDRTSFECNNSSSSEKSDHNTSKSREAISDHETAEPDTIVPSDPLQEDRTSFECNNSSSSEELDHNTCKSTEVMSDNETDKPDCEIATFAPKDSLKNYKTSFDYNKSSSAEESDHNASESRELISDNETAGSDCKKATFVHKDHGHINQTSSRSKESDSDSSFYSSSDDECDTALSQEVDIKDVNELIVEMSQTVHKYINNIKNLDISVEWELPSTLIAEKGIRKSEGGLKGPLEPEEVSFLKKRLRQFCKEYNINSGAIPAFLANKVSKFSFPNDLRLKFLQYLCKDYINDRNPMTVFNAISRLGTRKGKYSSEEENFLTDMYHNYKGAYLHTVCGLVLNRHRTQIFKKIERLKRRGFLGLRASPNDVKIKPLKLRNLILKNLLHRRNYDTDRLKYRLNKRSWMSIGREYNVSPALAKAIYMCEIFPQIFAEHPVKFDRFFTKMIYRISRSDWLTWEEVKWKELSSLLYNVGPVFVYVMLRKIIVHCVPEEKWGSFTECAEYLHHTVLPYFENGPKKILLNQILVQPSENDDDE